jgi:hypothetical protein
MARKPSEHDCASSPRLLDGGLISTLLSLCLEAMLSSSDSCLHISVCVVFLPMISLRRDNSSFIKPP